MATRAERRQATQNRLKAMSYQPRAEAFRVIRDKGPISTKEVAEVLEVDVKGLSYHVRKLKEYKCIEEVNSRIVRNSLETFYCATEQHMVDTEEWGELAEDEPEMAEFLVDDFMQAIVDDYTESRQAGVVGLDDEFWIVRRPLVLDPESIREAQKAAKEFEDKMITIAARSAKRRSTEGTKEIRTSFSVVLFKMPKRSRR